MEAVADRRHPEERKLQQPGKLTRHCIRVHTRQGAEHRAAQPTSAYPKSAAFELPKRFSTTEQVAAIRCIVEACKTRQMSASIVFVDFRKAFDSLSRTAIASLLEQHCVPPLLIQAVTDLYTDSKAFVLTEDGPTFEVPTTSGVLQGDPLSLLI